MPARADDLAAENKALREENEGLRHEIEVLSAKVAGLEGRLGQGSGNSSLAPSADSPKSRAERRAAQREAAKAKRAGERRARGKQPGAEGKGLSMREHPDEVIDHSPERCDSCGNDLSDADVEGIVRRQVLDTPDPILVCTEHRSIKRCSCGVLSAGGSPPRPVPVSPTPPTSVHRPSTWSTPSTARSSAPKRRSARCSRRRSRPALSPPWRKRRQERSPPSWPRWPPVSSPRCSSTSIQSAWGARRAARGP